MAAGGAAAAGADIDIQAVEGIPRDTLVALLKRKDKEAKGLAAKLEKLEERYVKVVRFNKILREDRTSFQRFCGELLPESEGAFEEGAAQETPVNLDALLRQLSNWRGALEKAGEDRKVFRQFTELVFPGDESVTNLFESAALGPSAFDVLQQQWTVLEDLNSRSIAAVSAQAREQMVSHVAELDTARAGKSDAERKVEELRAQLTQLHREKAQALTQKLGGKAAQEAEEPQKPAESTPTVTAAGLPMGGGREAGAGTAGGGPQLRELREALDAAERRERESRQAAARREDDLRGSLDAQQQETDRLKREVDRLKDDGERHRAQARTLLDEKDGVMERLRGRMGELEQELSSNSFIAQLAEQQAGRDAEVLAGRRQVDHVNQTLAEIQRLLALSYSQERVLKDRIRELEASHGRGHVAGDYLKHVMMKYMEYTQVGDLKAQGLVPVLCTLLELTPEERGTVEQASIPQTLLLLNQAVGGAAKWLGGGGEVPAPTEGGGGSGSGAPVDFGPGS